MKDISDFQRFLSTNIDLNNNKNIIITMSMKLVSEVIVYLQRKYGDDVDIFINGKKAMVELSSPGWFSPIYTIKSLMCERKDKNDGKLVDMKSSSVLLSNTNITIKKENIEWIFLNPRVATDESSLDRHIEKGLVDKNQLCVLVDPDLSLYKEMDFYDDVRSAVYRYGRGLTLPSYLLK